MTDTSPGRALGIYTQLSPQPARATEAEITFRAWAPSQAPAPSYHQTQNVPFFHTTRLKTIALW